MSLLECPSSYIYIILLNISKYSYICYIIYKYMKLKFLKDILGQDYIGLDVDPTIPDKNGLTLNDILGIGYEEIPVFDLLNNNLLNRNSDTYHLTVFNVMEYTSRKNFNTDIIGNEIKSEQIEYKGIGSISQGEKTTYFVVVDCPILNDIRYLYGYNSKDLHITIGFTHKDLFNAPKTTPNVWVP